MKQKTTTRHPEEQIHMLDTWLDWMVLHVCGRQRTTSSPKDDEILILEAHEYMTLHGKKDIDDVIKSRILRLRGSPGLLE